MLATGTMIAASVLATTGAADAAAQEFTPVPGPDTVVEPGEPHPDVNTGPSTKRVSYWEKTYDDGVKWEAKVHVDRGESGAVTKCTDGTILYGASVDPGKWIWGGDCTGHGQIFYISHYDI